jgi:hypothetical protein
VSLFAALFLICSPAAADEGMWPFNHLPLAQLRQRYGFEPSDAWLEHVRRATVRVSSCSGSFVSAQGLTLTNQHCAEDCLARISDAGHDYARDGFYAQTAGAERVCPGMWIQQLEAISDVTPQLRSATAGLSGAARTQALNAEIARLEQACAASQRATCEVVSLYHGGLYELYQYHRYEDVRLVFAPEYAVAQFGGDPDNFNFPRFSLDVTFLRAYEQGKPAATPRHLLWSSTPLEPNDLTFVIGSPGSTERLRTIAELEFLRDRSLVEELTQLARYRGFLTQYSERSSEARRLAASELFGVENTFKNALGERQALLEPSFFHELVEAERELRARVSRNPSWQREYGGAWQAIASAQERGRAFGREWFWIEGPAGWRPPWARTSLFYYARTLVRGAAERARPNAERLEEFGDARLGALEQRLFGARPLDRQFEAAKLALGFEALREELGADHAFVRQVLGRASPAERARELVLGCRLHRVAERQRLWRGGQAAVLASRDPMIRFALAIDAQGRALRQRHEAEREAVQLQNSELIARARFAVYGTDSYPDATSSPRLSFGTVRGWREPRGAQLVPAFTRVGGVFERATGRAPYALPQRWLRQQSRLDPDTPFDFASDADVVGGNSGSAVLNRAGELVGLLFDGNIHSLGGTYGFDIARNRAVSVDVRAIWHALDVVYGARRVLAELERAPLR